MKTPSSKQQCQQFTYVDTTVSSFFDLITDFDKKAKKEPTPLLEQFLCHVAKTGQTM